MIVVSIYITTRNRQKLLERAILSVLNQSYRNIEVIVIDDSSDCDNETMIRSVQHDTDIPIIYARNDSPRGACYSRNKAVSMARGKYITGLDDDDEFRPERIERFIHSYRPEYAFVCSNDNLVQKNGRQRSTRRPQFLGRQALLNAAENLAGNQIFTEKDKLVAIGGFDESFPAFQDFDTFYRLVSQFGTAFVLQENLQNIYRNTNTPSISTVRNQFFGMVHFYLKHRNQMNNAQKRKFILRYRLLKAKLPGMEKTNVNTMEIILYSGKRSFKTNLLMYIKNRINRTKLQPVS